METVKKILRHGEWIRKIKFFSEKHTILGEIFHEINVSIWTDMKKEEDQWFRDNSAKILRYVETKMTEGKDE